MQCKCGGSCQNEAQRFTDLQQAQAASGQKIMSVPCVILSYKCPSCLRRSQTIRYEAAKKTAVNLLSLMGKKRK